jgi:1,4-alpha-glucan branching enzyme
MLKLDRHFHVLTDPFIQQLYVHEDDKLLVYRRGPLVFVFNFHPTKSFSDLRIPVPDPKNYKQILNSDSAEFEGAGLVDPNVVYFKQDMAYAGREQSIQIYIPARSAQVLAPQ